jgi:NADPH2:quinone reductase
MKAIICRQFGSFEDLQFGEFPDPVPRSGDVLLSVRVAALGFAEMLMVQGGYQVKPPLPFVPGFDAAGVVLEVGPEVQGIAVGQRVLCSEYSGAYAERRAVPAASIFPIADGVGFEAAAAHYGAHGTAYYALVERAALKSGETLVVHGAAGGVGLAAVEIGRLLGARVIASVGSDDKMDLVRRYGAEDVFNYTGGVRGILKSLTNGRGADVILDVVGGEVFEQSLYCVAWGGRLLPIGFTGGQIPRIPANLPLLKGYSVVGVFWGACFEQDPPATARVRRALMDWLAQGRLRPHISAVLPLAQTVDGMRRIAGRKAQGKILVVPGATTYARP